MSQDAAADRVSVWEAEDPGLPPWLWFWAAMFLLGLPGLAELWRASFETLAFIQQSTQQISAVAAGYENMNLLAIGVWLEVLPPTLLGLGLLTLLFPGLRRAYVERRYRLSPAPAGLSTLEQVGDFLDLHAPGLDLRVNLLRPGPLAFVYPRGYGRARLAIFGGFLKLWKADRGAAEAVLLHEIAHYRRGDFQIVGAGSFFEGILKLAGLYYVLGVVVPSVFLWIEGKVRLYVWQQQWLASFEGTDVEFWPYVLGQIPSELLGLLATALIYLFQLGAVFVLPLIAIWSAELGADHFAASRQGGAEGVRRGLGAASGRVSLWRWLLFRLSHPPVGLRRWFLARQGRAGLTVLILVFPLAYLVQLLLLQAMAFTVYASSGEPIGMIWEEALSNTRAWMGAQSVDWLVMAALLLLWPVVAWRWDEIFGGRERVGRGSHPAYALVGVVAASAGLAGLLLRPF